MTVTYQLRKNTIWNFILLGAFILLSGGCCTYDPSLHGELKRVKQELAGSTADSGGFYANFKSTPFPDSDRLQMDNDVANLVTIAKNNKRICCNEPIKQMELLQKMYSRDRGCKKVCVNGY